MHIKYQDGDDGTTGVTLVDFLLIV